MEAKEIEKIKAYLKELKIQEVKEWVNMPGDYKIDLPEYIGKNIFWLIWKNRKMNYELSFSSPSLTITCKMKGLYCVDSFGFNEDPYEEPTLPSTIQKESLYASLLASPLISKEDLIQIYTVNMEKADLSLIERIIE